MKFINVPPPKIALLYLINAIAFHWLLLPIWDTFRLAAPIVGTAIALLGVLLGFWSWLLFKKYDIALRPTSDTHKLIFEGPYRFTRNPIYLGMVLFLLGIAMYIGTLPFYLVAVAFFITLNNVYIPYEEIKLSSKFSDSYLDYTRQVRRWL